VYYCTKITTVPYF
nr:immunoglobulin heavy chain junction region [Mus musculus]